MNDDYNILKCSESILNFLLNSDKEYSIHKTLHIPSYDKMMENLKICNSTMVDFTLYLNKKYKIIKNDLYIESPREFFSDQSKSLSFYNKVISILKYKEKELKINKIISNV